MARDGVHNLDIKDTEDLAEFLLHHLNVETRAKLMVERPILYSRLFPTVSAKVLSTMVLDRVIRERRNK